MHRSDILRSSAFRLALAFSALFFLTFVAAGFIAFQIIQSDLHERLDRNLSETFDMISRSYTDGDIEDLIGTVQTYAASAQSHNRVFYLADSAGQVLAGNVTLANVHPGLSTAPAAAVGLEGSLGFRVLQGVVAGNILVVGASFEETDELGGLALARFGWAGAIAATIAVAAGILLAGTVRKRTDAIAGTMSEVGHGKLLARIPLRGSNDDIDVLSGQINAALDRLAALVESMRQVSVDIAHDLKTPLNRLAIIIEGALEKAERGEGNEPDLLQAQIESQRINSTFEALLRIAQIESGARRERFTEVEIGAILSVLLEAYEDVALENGQVLTLRAGPECANALVTGDRDLLTQLFANLIENSIRHANGGSKIDMSIECSAKLVSASVIDEGPGIPDGERDKVFQRLYRLEKSRTTEGTGLGLSMVKAIADLHGAHITLRSMHPGLAVKVEFARANVDSARWGN